MFLSREDIKKIFAHYSVDSGDKGSLQQLELKGDGSQDKINYYKLTEDMGANSNSIRLIQQSKKYLTQFKQLRASSEKKYDFIK